MITVSIAEVQPNPKNPRKIKDAQLDKLVDSIRKFPKMLEKRPLVCLTNEPGALHKYVVIGGNQRLKAASRAGLKEVPVILADDWNEEEIKQFVVRDNINFGEHDIDMLVEHYDIDELAEFGLDVKIDLDDPVEAEDPDEDEADLPEEPAPEVKKWAPDCLFPSNNLYEVPTLKLDLQGRADMPFVPYGSVSRKTYGVGCYHFYVEDYRFQTLWDNPYQILQSGLTSIVEPNLSLFDTTPISYGLHLIYKKRWLARLLQDEGIGIIVDLNVSKKFFEYALLGVPKGWKSYCTRGYEVRLAGLEAEYNLALEHSGGDPADLYFLVYGGAKGVKQFCADHNCIFVEEIMNTK